MKKRILAITFSAVALMAGTSAYAYYQRQTADANIFGDPKQGQEAYVLEAKLDFLEEVPVVGIPLQKEEAVALAAAHLTALGLEPPRLVYAYLTFEEGVAVWSIEFVGELEFYVNAETGGFLKAPGMVNLPTSEGVLAVVSREEAVEIAQGLVSGRLIEVDTDVERGREVWYVAIADGSLVHEIYVDRQTGEVVLHEIYEN